MSEIGAPNAIGGYFEMELPSGNSYFHDKTLLYQSARAAFRALIKTKAHNRFLVPNFICNSMISPLIAENIEYSFYDIDESFGVPESLYLNDDDLLLYVNYYGLCQTHVDRLLKRYPPKQLVFDFAQAFFEPPKHEALATIYSPRKFFGVPDGGMLVTSSEIEASINQDSGSMDRVTHLLKRLNEDPECAYPDYIKAEKSLDDSTPKSMSRLTRRLLKSIDYTWVKKKRTENFLYLHSCLGAINEFDIDSYKVNAPLSYPFITNIKGLREYLISNRVYTPTYWREAGLRLSCKWNEKMIVRLLPIPIDQRYDKTDLDRIVSLILNNCIGSEKYEFKFKN